jgi:hypothetical protein
LPEPGGSGPVVLDEMRVLRLCSVFEPAALSERSAGYDAIGGMQNHTAELSRMGACQLILTSPRPGRAAAAGLHAGMSQERVIVAGQGQKPQHMPLRRGQHHIAAGAPG